MQCPWMANQDVTDFERDSLHTNLAGLDRPKGVCPLHTMCTWRHFDWAVLTSDPDQTKTDNDCVHGERKIGSFRKERALVIHMHSLIFRASQRHVAAPLVGDDPVVQQPADDAQHSIVEEEFRHENRRLEWKGKKVAMGAPVRRRAAVEISQQARPESLAARFDHCRYEVVPENAEAPLPHVLDHPSRRFDRPHHVLQFRPCHGTASELRLLALNGQFLCTLPAALYTGSAQRNFRKQ